MQPGIPTTNDPLVRNIKDYTITQPSGKEEAADGWSLAFLIEHILKSHHEYVKDSIAFIGGLAEQAARLDGPQHLQLFTIHCLWKDIVEEISVHMKKEELVLFPYIKNLEKLYKGQIKEFPPTHFTTVKSPVRMLKQEHEVIGNLVLKIRGLSDNYSPVWDASETCKNLYARLKEFEDDWRQHIYLENNILFAKAIQLEEKLASFK